MKKLISLLVVVVVLVGYFFTRGSYLDRVTPEYPITAEQYVNSSTGKLHVIVLHKSSCPVCRKYGSSILDSLGSLGKDQISILEVSGGIPTYLDGIIEGSVSVPYVVVLSDGGTSVWQGSISSERDLLGFREAIPTRD